MNAHTQSSNEAKLGIKAYQNLVGSLHAFDRFAALIPTGDHILLSSVFCFSVVKYAKPFVETETPFGKTRYPVRHLKAEQGFDYAMHTRTPKYVGCSRRSRKYRAENIAVLPLR
jgi:hypothetical protein